MTETQQQQPKTFIAAAMQYFGRLPEQSLGAFRDELHALTDQDRKDLSPMLSEALGCTVTP